MSDFVIKTVSFLSGKILIGKVEDSGCWRDALFVGISNHPETGERTAFFKPCAPGRASQNLSREEYLKLVSGAPHVGPSIAASGLAKAYMTFLEDEEAIPRCVRAHTTECGPSNAFIGILPECECPPTVEKEGSVIKVGFKNDKEIPNVKDF